MVVALVLAHHARGFTRLCLVLLLRPQQRNCVGRRLSSGGATDCPIGKTYGSFLHGQMVRSLSNHEAHRLGR